MDIDVANRFCGSDGLILKLQPVPGSWDCHFDVEWLSDFAHEKERLFVFATSMKIVDIQYFVGQKLKKNSRYLTALSLFSSLFRGQFISPVLRVRKNQKCWRVLLDLILVHKENNGIECGGGVSSEIQIPLYLQQLFYQILDNFRKDQELKLLIKSEYELLDQSLRNELLLFPDHNSDDNEHIGFTLSPLMQTLCSNDQIVMMQEYIWVIHGDQLEELQRAEGTYRMSSEMYYFNSSNADRVSFQFEMIRKTGGLQFAGFGIQIRNTPQRVDGVMAVNIDEVQWNMNDIQFFDKCYRFEGRIAFEDKLIDTVGMMTVKVALNMSGSQQK